jgi:anti-sigma-K factor RskA
VFIGMSMSGEQSDGPDGDKILVAEFALGLLDAAEHERVGRRIATDRPLRRDLALWRLRLASLDGQFVETPAPSGVLEKIERRLFGTIAPAGGLAGFWNNLNLWRGLAAAGLAVAIFAVGYTQLVPRAPLTGKELVAALEQEGSGVKLVAFYDEATGTVRLAALGGAAVPNKDFELWAIKGSNAPVSMGVIQVDARNSVEVSQKVKIGFDAGTILAVTLEPKGGSPTGAPTGPIVAKGAATAI